MVDGYSASFQQINLTPRLWGTLYFEMFRFLPSNIDHNAFIIGASASIRVISLFYWHCNE